MNNAALIYVHPAITWQKIDDDKLQIRVPDGQHLTLTESSNTVDLMLKQLSSPLEYAEIVTWAQHKNIGQEELETTLATLHEYSIVIEKCPKEETGIFNNVLDFNVNTSESIRAGLPFPYFLDFEVIGQGDIHDCVSKSVEQVRTSLSAYENQAVKAKRNKLRVVCSDTGDQQFLTAQNAQAIEDKVAFLPVQWNDEFLSIGPLYIPEESACYECLNVRRRAASNFLPELDGLLKSPVTRSVNATLDATMSHLVSYAIERYLSIISRGMFHLIKPNEMESWDILKAEKTAGEVLRVPRCDACGRKKASDPIRAIRDLNN